MKTPILVLTILTLACTARAQTVIDWFTLDAAGGTQASANYTTTCTLGQSDVGGRVSASANYQIVPGFWALESFGNAVRPPALQITLSGPNVILSWPSPASGFALEQTDSLNVLPATWSDTPGVINDNGILKSITLSHDVARRFYRLRKN